MCKPSIHRTSAKCETWNGVSWSDGSNTSKCPEGKRENKLINAKRYNDYQACKALGYLSFTDKDEHGGVTEEGFLRRGGTADQWRMVGYVSEQLRLWKGGIECAPEVELTDEELLAILDREVQAAVTDSDKRLFKSASTVVRGSWHIKNKKFWQDRLPEGYDSQYILHIVEVSTIRKGIAAAIAEGTSIVPWVRILLDPQNTILGPDWLNRRYDAGKIEITTTGELVPTAGYSYELAEKDGIFLRNYRLPIPPTKRQIAYMSDRSGKSFVGVTA